VTARLIGGPDLRARLASLADAGPEFAQTWADDTVAKMRQTAPNARSAQSRTFTTKTTRLRAAVYGAFWWIFVDRGTKAHDIFGSGGKNPPDTLMFQAGGNTIFASKVHHPRTRRNPFISRAAQGALASSKWADTVIKQWNGRRSRSHRAFL
jgi:hypothetical protein